ITADKGTKVTLSDYLGTAETKITVWTGGTDKKRTAKQEYKLAPRAPFYKADKIDPRNGKISLDSMYEVRSIQGKWGKLPKIAADVSFPIRIKPTAKSNRDFGYSGLAASESWLLDIKYNQVDRNVTEASMSLSREAEELKNLLDADKKAAQLPAEGDITVSASVSVAYGVPKVAYTVTGEVSAGADIGGTAFDGTTLEDAYGDTLFDASETNDAYAFITLDWEDLIAATGHTGAVDVDIINPAYAGTYNIPNNTKNIEVLDYRTETLTIFTLAGADDGSKNITITIYEPATPTTSRTRLLIITVDVSGLEVGTSP
ncbi:MAG: hypothetical protein FWH06_05550, partial [Oscillospiraceae bacterium]|nr:hypothetical protein [Oscillospiraceae bacterium]